MTRVFFGGSRNIGRLNPEVRKRIDNVISNRFLVVIGDANGADKALQSYLNEKEYSNVTVYCSGSVCRNNLGHWKTEHVATSHSRKDFDHYASKDLRMSDEADYGFFLWDGKSKGTLNNIATLIAKNKHALVYLSPSKQFLTLKHSRDLESLLARCDARTAAILRKWLNNRNQKVAHQAALGFG